MLLTPLLLVLLFLIFEFGRFFGSWLIMTNAAREGTRRAVVLPFDSSEDPKIHQRVQDTAQFLTVNAVPCSGTEDSCIDIIRGIDLIDPNEKFVTVMARYKLYTLTPIVGDIPFIGPINYPGYLEVVGLSTMRWE